MKIEIKIKDNKADIEVHQSDGSVQRYSIRKEEDYRWKVTDRNLDQTVCRIEGDYHIRNVTIDALKEILKRK